MNWPSQKFTDGTERHCERMNIHIKGTLILLLLLQFSHAQVAENAPEDKPLLISSSDEYLNFRKNTSNYTIQSRKSWPSAKARYLADPKVMLFVSAEISDKFNRHEMVFVKVKAVSMNLITGNISSDILGVAGYKVGDEFRLRESQILDWTISNPDGTEDGNLIGKYIDSIQSVKE